MSEHFPGNEEAGGMPPAVFVVFKYKSGEHPDILWELQGIFTTEQQAVEACREHHYGYWPEQLNRLLPPESEIPQGVVYPFGPPEATS